MMRQSWYQHQNPEKQYYSALICDEGHVLTAALELYEEKTDWEAQKFCETCGGKILRECPHCHTTLRGDMIGAICVVRIAPNCCWKCGSDMPWLDKKAKAARELIFALEGLDEAEKESLLDSFIQLLVSPNGDRAALFQFRLEQGLSKAKGKALPLLLEFGKTVLAHGVALALFKVAGVS
jgi:hypothetical protein